MYTKSEVANMLNVSETYVDRLVEKNILHVNGNVFSQADVDDYIARHEQANNCVRQLMSRPVDVDLEPLTEEDIRKIREAINDAKL